MASPADRIDLADAILVGVGNPLRGDDGAGPELAARFLRDLPHLPALDAGSRPEEFAEEILALAKGRPIRRAVVFDAAPMGLPAGSVRRLPLSRIGDATVSTHRIPIHLFAELLKALGGIESVIVGIEPSCVEPGAPLSAPVREAIDRIVGHAAKERALEAPPRFPEDEA